MLAFRFSNWIFRLYFSPNYFRTKIYVQCFIITSFFSIEFDWIWIIIILLRNETVNNWQQTTYKHCWMWAMGNKLLICVLREIAAIQFQYTLRSVCILYSHSHAHHPCSEWYVLWCVLSFMILLNVNIQLPAMNRCLYVFAVFLKCRGFFSVLSFFQ